MISDLATILGEIRTRFWIFLATKFWDPKIWSPRKFCEPIQKFELRPRTTTTRKSIEFCIRYRSRHPKIRPDGPEKPNFVFEVENRFSCPKPKFRLLKPKFRLLNHLLIHQKSPKSLFLRFKFTRNHRNAGLSCIFPPWRFLSMITILTPDLYM